ncbi:TrfB-related DNA-binding protein [Methylomonas methanica]|nr:TrfB-related DNA-binding protein [Methylomonas methanica]
MTQSRKKRRMTSVEFEAVRPLLHMTQSRIDAAYSVLVLGEVYQRIADRYGWSRQAVTTACNTVLATFDAYKRAQQAELAALSRDLPAGWAMLSMAAPVDLIETFKMCVSLRQPNKQAH